MAGSITRWLQALLGGQRESGGQWCQKERGALVPTGVTWDVPRVSPQVGSGTFTLPDPRQHPDLMLRDGDRVGGQSQP